MEYVIDHMRLSCGKTKGRLPPGDSDAEHAVPVAVRRIRRKSYYVRRPDEEGAPYCPAILRRRQEFRMSGSPTYYQYGRPGL